MTAIGLAERIQVRRPMPWLLVALAGLVIGVGLQLLATTARPPGCGPLQGGGVPFLAAELVLLMCGVSAFAGMFLARGLRAWFFLVFLAIAFFGVIFAVAIVFSAGGPACPGPFS
jgi:hypothetical protein